jgi:hypothetical protein
VLADALRSVLAIGILYGTLEKCCLTAFRRGRTCPSIQDKIAKEGAEMVNLHVWHLDPATRCEYRSLPISPSCDPIIAKGRLKSIASA